MGLLIGRHFRASYPVFRLDHELELSPGHQLCMCVQDAATSVMVRTQMAALVIYPLGHLQALKGCFQFRNPVLELWGTEKMRLVFFS